MSNTVRIKPFFKESLALSTKKDTFPVIEVIPNQIVTGKRTERVKKKGDVVLSDVDKDILKLVVVERHRKTGNIGLGLVKGFGLKRGALGSSVAHDSHNVVVVGCNDEDIIAAVAEIERLQGGLVVCDEGRVVAKLGLPIAGLLSDRPSNEVAESFKKVGKAAEDLGSVLPAPFVSLSFLALPVIPKLRLTDLGLVDVDTFRLLSPDELG